MLLGRTLVIVNKSWKQFNYVLMHWIDNHASKIISEFTDIASVFTYDKTIAANTTGTSNFATEPRAAIPKFIIVRLKEIQNKTYSQQKGTFKCNYCRLMFNTKIKRKQHEQEWHTTTKPDGL